MAPSCLWLLEATHEALTEQRRGHVVAHKERGGQCAISPATNLVLMLGRAQGKCLVGHLFQTCEH